MNDGTGIRITISAIVIVLLLGASFVIVPDEVTALQDGDYEYTVSFGFIQYATITEYLGSGGDITIPTSLNGHTVVAIAQEAFNNGHGYMVTSVIIPDCVTSLGAYTFANCDAITTVTIGTGMVAIGDEVFYNCHSLVAVNVDADNDHYRSIGGVVYNETLTELVYFPEKKTGTVVIPDTVTAVPWQAFYERDALESVTIGSGLTSIGDYMFDSCTSLTTVTFSLPSNVTSIGRESFFMCGSLTSINIPEGVTDIDYWAFRHCGSLNSVTLPDSLVSLGGEAFGSCVSLTDITIPENLTAIDSDTFIGCTSLTSIKVHDGNQNYSDRDGVMYDKNGTTLICYPCGRSGSFTVPEGVTAIGEMAFVAVQHLTSVTMNEGLTSIMDSAFYYCTNLTSVTLPGSITELGTGVFMYCSSLSSVTLSSGIESLGNGTFYFCTNLTSMIIPGSVTDLGRLTFFGCNNLTSITFLGLVSPEAGLYWMNGTSPALRGHAYAASNFPVPGSTFYGLTMGAYVTAVAPSAPTDLEAVLVDGKVSLTWATPDEIGGSPLTDYKVYRSTTENGTYALITTVSVAAYNDTDVEDGVTYWYKVSAVNGAGEGVSCAAVSVVVPEEGSGDDSTMLLLGAVIVIALLAVVGLLLIRRRRAP
jgi:hypothetical protein